MTSPEIGRSGTDRTSASLELSVHLGGVGPKLHHFDRISTPQTMVTLSKTSEFVAIRDRKMYG